MDASAVAPVLRLAGAVADPRRHNRVHPLSEMIVMALAAVLCGCDGWADVAEFCRLRRDWLAGFLTLPGGVPSHDTFGRVFARLDPDQLERMLRKWMGALGVASGGRVLAVDGKSLRRSFEHAWDESGMAHVVSAFAAENGLALAQLGLGEAGDAGCELTAIGRLPGMLDLRGCTVTIDSAGCQRHIARQVVEGGGDYVLQVKVNQPRLLRRVAGLMDALVAEGMAPAAGWDGADREVNDAYEQTDGGHGRVETRRVWFTSEVRWPGRELREQWAGLGAVALVERAREVVRKDGSGPDDGGFKCQSPRNQSSSRSVERHYYILSNGRLGAEEAGRLIRGHWSIENRLHHVLDVSFDEDRCRVRKGHGAANLSRVRRLALNLLRLNEGKQSMRQRRKLCGWSTEYLTTTLLRGLPPQP